MTKPQSLGYALNDSPVGLAGWIVEKFHSWTNDDLDRMVINDDEVLAIVSLYWFTQSITSSMRLYYENGICLLYTSPSPRDDELSRMPSSA